MLAVSQKVRCTVLSHTRALWAEVNQDCPVITWKLATQRFIEVVEFSVWIQNCEGL